MITIIDKKVKNYYNDDNFIEDNLIFKKHYEGHCNPVLNYEYYDIIHKVQWDAPISRYSY